MQFALLQVTKFVILTIFFLCTNAERCDKIKYVFGGVAQLGERTVRIRKVESSILFVSTKYINPAKPVIIGIHGIYIFLHFLIRYTLRYTLPKKTGSNRVK